MGEVIIRSYKEQFEIKDRKRIEQLITGFEKLGESNSEYEYYVHEISSCLKSGLLFAVLHVTASFFELFVRDILITKLHLTDKKELYRCQVEREAEENRYLTFPNIINELYKLHVLTERECNDAKTFYYEWRVPLMHGILRRFIFGKPETGFEFDFIEYLCSRNHGMEEVVEDNALEVIKYILDFMMHHIENIENDWNSRLPHSPQ